MELADRLLAIEEIKQLKARFFRHLDTKDWVGYASVYAPDAILDVSGEGVEGIGVIEGAQAIADFVHSQVGRVVTVHHGHTPEIEIISDTTAVGTWAMEDVLRWPEGEAIRGLHGYGHYHEAYVRIDGRWHIQSSTLSRLRTDVELPE
jgi:hypothetical protein